jgi:bacteriocin-like protein
MDSKFQTLSTDELKTVNGGWTTNPIPTYPLWIVQKVASLFN